MAHLGRMQPMRPQGFVLWLLTLTLTGGLARPARLVLPGQPVGLAAAARCAPARMGSAKGSPKKPAKPAPIDVQVLRLQFAAVRELPRVLGDKRNRTEDLEDDNPPEPSFRRLFTHETWRRYTGGPTIWRWFKAITLWRHSSVLQAVAPCSALICAWAFLVPRLVPPRFASQAIAMQLPLSLQGAAIGLLLVFRTNNAYRRLETARSEWGNLIHICREIATKCSATLDWSVTCDVCRYLCVFAWTLRDKLRDADKRDDIIKKLLPSDEFEWLKVQRSRPLAVLSQLRRLIYRECEAGRLSQQMQYILDIDIKELNGVHSSCERLFTSPIPPNMARHGMRSLTLWLCALPVVLVGQLPPLSIATWAITTSYIYIGIDELGAQVEQPFRTMPLWQLCHLCQLNVEEALCSPEMPLYKLKPSKAVPYPMAQEDSSGLPFQSFPKGDP